MIISRYSFGSVTLHLSPRKKCLTTRGRYYGVIIPCIMNLIGMIGFSILNCILGGQVLASVSDDNISWTCVPCLLKSPFLFCV